MSWTTGMRRLSRMSPWTVLLIAGLGCGGGDKGPTGPQGGAADFDLVSLGRAGLPADVEVEDCIMTRFYSGGITIDPNTDTWELRLKVHDGNYGDWSFKDGGFLEDDGETVWFDSDLSGTSHEGTVNGAEVTIMYDWCWNGVADVQLVFDR